MEKDEDVHRIQELESNKFLLLQQLDRLYVYVDFRWFLTNRFL
jgi:hypothetical protein